LSVFQNNEELAAQSIATIINLGLLAKLLDKYYRTEIGKEIFYGKDIKNNKAFGESFGLGA
jgi:hypothetical protein